MEADEIQVCRTCANAVPQDAMYRLGEGWYVCPDCFEVATGRRLDIGTAIPRVRTRTVRVREVPK